MTANEIKKLYLEKLRGYKSFNGNQAPVVTTEMLALFEVIAEVVNKK
jgi:hypothetical protein